MVGSLDEPPFLMEKYYIYILQCKDERLYTGYSSDFRKRIKNHKDGRVVSTKYRRPFELIHYEYFVSKKDAKAREIYLKSGAGCEQLKQFLKNTLL